MDTNHALTAFAALSQSTRLDVFRLLVKAGKDGMLSGDIGEALTCARTPCPPTFQSCADQLVQNPPQLGD